MYSVLDLCEIIIGPTLKYYQINRTIHLVSIDYCNNLLHNRNLRTVMPSNTTYHRTSISDLGCNTTYMSSYKYNYIADIFRTFNSNSVVKDYSNVEHTKYNF